MKKFKEYISFKNHPLKIWKSREVTELLADFFGANFKKAGLPGKMGRDYVLDVFKKRKTSDREDLRKFCDEILQKAKEKAKNTPNEIEPLDLFDFSEVETFLDIGANKLTTINYLAKKHKNIRKFIGIDIIPQRNKFYDPKRSSYIRVSSGTKSFPVKKESVDFINLQFVLHHFPDAISIKRMLHLCRKILKPGGILLLWEESFTKIFDPDLINFNKKLGIKTNKTLTNRFYALSDKKRWEFIAVNDWLINVNSPHMLWTGEYKAWNEWETLMYEAGFYFKKSYNFGLRVNGRLKQGAHMIGMFKKLKITDGANVFLKNKKLDKFLFMLRDDKPNILYPGKWGVFGGGMEKGESPLETIKREIREELNIQMSGIKKLGKEKVIHVLCGEKFPRTTNYFVAEINADPGKIEIFEGQKARYFTLKEIFANKNFGPLARRMTKKYFEELNRF